MSKLTLATTYLASFTLAQLALKVTCPSLPRCLLSSLPAPLYSLDIRFLCLIDYLPKTETLTIMTVCENKIYPQMILFP